MGNVIRKSTLFLAAAVVFVLTTSVAQAHVRLATVFADSMVLQRDHPINIWGTAAIGEKISVVLHGKTYLGRANDKGTWLIKLSAQSAATGQSIEIIGENTIKLNNIAFGDVYLASGQSNMEFKVKEVLTKFPQENKLTQYPDIRQFKVKRHFDFKHPQQDVAAGSWLSASQENVGEFSAVAWFFAKNLYQKHQVPIGIISSSVGATPVESWMSIESLAHFPEAQALALNLADTHYIEQLKKEYAKERADWREKNKSPLNEKKKKLPFMLMHRTSLDFKPVGLYNAMIAPLAKLKYAAVIWYQGESNTPDPARYADKFSTMINQWRTLFEQPQLPFLFVQLANFQLPDEQPSESAWADIRDQQTQVLRTVKNTAMALAIDVGERHNIHPLDKQTVGDRLALGARHLVYAETKLNYLSPLVDKATLTHGKAIISFQHINNGLMVKGDRLLGFAIAGADKKFIWANAKLDNNLVTVWHDSINSPKHVRYAWGNNPENANLYSDQGLPATPFSYEF